MLFVSLYVIVGIFSTSFIDFLCDELGELRSLGLKVFVLFSIPGSNCAKRKGLSQSSVLDQKEGPGDL